MGLILSRLISKGADAASLAVAACAPENAKDQIAEKMRKIRGPKNREGFGENKSEIKNCSFGSDPGLQFFAEKMQGVLAHDLFVFLMEIISFDMIIIHRSSYTNGLTGKCNDINSNRK